MASTRRRPFDTRATRHTLRFGDLEASLADADVAQVHDALVRLHVFRDPTVQRLCGELRQLLTEPGDTRLELGLPAARKVQLAVYADRTARRVISPALANARLQAFHYIESRTG